MTAGNEKGICVTLGPKGNRFRPDAAIWNDIEQAALKVDPARLNTLLESNDEDGDEEESSTEEDGEEGPGT